ncbi:uncharacterized protein LOC111339131 [Stylophora pistillata]|uniref:uncharacterized protein LOC111339131 n=1 Tax=Stylophora pistillata TaxID=50429 RepID=UPI000C03AAB8|nr:uncharacterized protein LOC111339131 [Stylophora pistillata]
MLNRMRGDRIATPRAHQLIYDVNICIRLRLHHCQVSRKARVSTEDMKRGQPSTFHHIHVHVESKESMIFSSTQHGKFCIMHIQHIVSEEPKNGCKGDYLRRGPLKKKSTENDLRLAPQDQVKFADATPPQYLFWC